MDDKRDSKELTRRDFIEKGAIGAFLASIVTAAFGVLKLPKPSVFPDPMQKFKIGDPESIAIGEFKEFPGGNLIVFRDREGFYAISKICTHLGCIVNQTKDGFTCPCHGSRFTPEGKVTGP
ncbi:MAG: Rieske 2Fe-2S domain-containing protein, partial [Deltaproteobacteria bacterium]|nr:Rieske 2Fe-2S domain-containing protein [Deltaproteobacteria bacterium]